MIKNPLIVAHRGASADSPENTMPAFRLAWQQGADAIEGDFRLTGDGHVVCIHDKDTARVANRNLVIENSSLEDLRALDVGSHHGQKYEGTQIPTLQEVLAGMPGHGKLYIEIKSGTEIIPVLLRDISQSRTDASRIVVISFDHTVLRAMKHEAPQHKCLLLASLNRRTGLNTTPPVDTIICKLEDINADGLSASADVVDENYIATVRNRGYEYHVWTVDDPVLAKHCGDCGVSSITTNVPALLKEAICIRRE